MVYCKAFQNILKIKIKIKLTNEFKCFLRLLGGQSLANNARGIVRNSSH